MAKVNLLLRTNTCIYINYKFDIPTHIIYTQIYIQNCSMKFIEYSIHKTNNNKHQ